jgi:uncharacterized protein
MVIKFNLIIAILWNESELFLNVKQTSGDAPTMRLTENQIESIRHAVKENFGSGTQVWLFGSCVDDSKRGGDIDLLVCPNPENMDDLLRKKIRLLGQFERALGERKIDIVVERSTDSRPIIQVAHQTGISL